MGSRNVDIVLRAYMPALDEKGRPLLTYNELRVLLHMARRSLDARGKDGRSARLYFAGRDDLIRALRDRVPTDDKALASARQVVKVALAGLVEKGLVQRVDDQGNVLPAKRSSAQRRARQTYRLALDERGVTNSYPSPSTGAVSNSYPSQMSEGEEFLTPPGIRNSYEEGEGSLTPYESIEDSTASGHDSNWRAGRQRSPLARPAPVDNDADDEQPANSKLAKVDGRGRFFWRCLTCGRVVGEGCNCPGRSR